MTHFGWFVTYKLILNWTWCRALLSGSGLFRFRSRSRHHCSVTHGLQEVIDEIQCQENCFNPTRSDIPVCFENI